VYGPFHSEKILGRALGQRRKEIILVTKVGFEFEGDNIVGRNSRFDYVTQRVEGCLKRLNTDWVDLMLIHWPDHNTPYDEPIQALEHLKSQGKIRYYGVSNFAPAMMEVCERVGHLATNQVGYNLFDRRVEKAILPYVKQQGIGYMAYGTLSYGLLTGAFTENTSFSDSDWRSGGLAFGLPLFQREHFLKELRVVARLRDLAARADKTVTQMAIAWVLRRTEVTVALVGIRNLEELDENIAGSDWRVTQDICDEIDRIFTEEGVPLTVNADQAL
jgi:aryl-alcohol dehydrogenase-like predicted oxidoreductase